MEIKSKGTGNVVISEEVVAKIAATAALDVAGVAGVVSKTQDIKSIVKSQKVLNSVNVTTRDGQFIIDIYVKLKEGIRVAEVAPKVQEAVKDSVQNMTGSVVSKVNVNICAIELEKDKVAK